MVRVLAAGDFHGNSIFARQLADKAVKENVELILLCGDIVESQGEHKIGIIAPFVDAGKKVLLVTGNHDGFVAGDLLAEIYGIRHVHGQALRYGDVGIVGFSGANCGWDALEEEEIFSTLSEGTKKISYLSKKIFMTHIFPKDSLMDKMSHSALPGSTGLLKAIKELKPDILFCSHAHEAEGVEEIIGNTRVICVGRQGKVLDI